MKKGKSVFISVLSVLSLLSVIIVIAGFAAREKIIYLSETSSQMIAELSSIRQKVYVASDDIPAGSEIIMDGDSPNVELSQIYSSIDSSLLINGQAGGFAQVDIKKGSPVLLSMIGDNEPVLTMEPERVVEEIPESFDIPFHIEAKYRDKNGKELADASEIILSNQVGEQSFSCFMKKIEGYTLKSIMIGKEKVYSFGAVRLLCPEEEKSMVYYYTDESGLKRTEITAELEVVYTYNEGEEIDSVDTGKKISGIPEIKENMVPADTKNGGGNAENAGSSAITFEDITGKGENFDERD